MATIRLKSLIKESTLGAKFSIVSKEDQGMEYVMAYPDVNGIETRDGLEQWQMEDSANRELYFVKDERMANDTVDTFGTTKESFMSEAIDKDLEKAIRDNVIASANENYKKFSSNLTYSSEKVPGWQLMPGSKFIRIVRDSSAWGFVATGDGTHKGIPYNMGDVFKAAGWNAPAKHVRGSAFEEGKEWNWTGPEYLK